MNAIRELAWTLWDTLETGDPLGHLSAWWAVVTGRVSPDDPAGRLTPAGMAAIDEATRQSLERGDAPPI